MQRRQVLLEGGRCDRVLRMRGADDRRQPAAAELRRQRRQDEMLIRDLHVHTIR